MLSRIMPGVLQRAGYMGTSVNTRRTLQTSCSSTLHSNTSLPSAPTEEPSGKLEAQVLLSEAVFNSIFIHER